MPDFLTKLIDDARKRIQSGYYDLTTSVDHSATSLRKAITSAKNNAIIAEIKPISPSQGPLNPTIDPVDAAVKFEKGGATALSVLTEPNNFGGNITSLRRIREHVQIPLLMKDIIIDEVQIQSAKDSGADCVLLIEQIFSKHYVASMEKLITAAHHHTLEVLLEAHNQNELQTALASGADIIGVNNRNLSTLKTDLQTTPRLLRGLKERNNKPIISESGIETSGDIRTLRKIPVDGFLIGSSLMLSPDLESKVREFTLA